MGSVRADWDDEQEVTRVDEGQRGFAMGFEDGEYEGRLSGAQSYWRMVAAASARELPAEERDGYAKGFMAGIEIGAKARKEGALPHPRSHGLADPNPSGIRRKAPRK